MKSTEKYICLSAKIHPDEAAATEAPAWMLLFKAGMGRLADGIEYLVDKDAFAMIAADWAGKGNDLHFDYEHASLKAEAAPAAGWIKELKWEDCAGVMARVEWTSKAAEFIKNKEYRYFSPVFGIRKKDKRVCWLDSVALTNRPRTTNLSPIMAKINRKGEQIMEKKELIEALELPETATDGDILSAVAKLGVKLPETGEKEVIPKSVIAALGLAETDGETIVTASIHALKQTVNNGVSVEAFKALQDKIAEKDASDAVAAAMSAGKVTPAQKDWATDYAKRDLEGFQVFVAKAPVVIPVTPLPGMQTEPAGIVDDSTLAVAKMFGNSKEDIEKYGK